MPLARSLAFKLTSIYVLLFSASVAVLFAVVGTLTSRSMEGEIRAIVEREARSLASEYRATGRTLAASLVERRLRHGDSAYYLLQAPDGSTIAGNVQEVPITNGPFAYRIPISAPPSTTGRAQTQRRHVIGYGIVMADGTYVMVAEDQDWLNSLHQAIKDAFLIAGLASVLLGIGGGLMLSRSILSRIEAVNDTAAKIVSGRIDSRIPVAAAGDEIDQLAENLNAMLDRIQGLMENLRQVSNDIAHDLRTPLSRLRQRLESARATATPDQLRSELDQAVAESDHLLETFSAMLRIAQIESGSRRANFAKVDMSELIDLVAATFAPVADDRAQHLTASAERNVTVIGDRELLTQMTINLVENAINHTPPGSSIEISLRTCAEGIVLVVADNGQGIPAAERKKVLRRFYRLESSRTTPGTGLGLALVSAIAELHGAKVEIEDNCPGLSARILLPSNSAMVDP